MIEMNKKYKTRDGKPVKIVCTDYKGEYPVVASIKIDEDEAIFFYKYDGRLSHMEHPYDLIEVTSYEHLKVDDKIMVSDDGMFWAKRHFAEVIHGVVHTFNDGKTSWSIKDKVMETVPWKYVRDQDGIDLL